jgi:hypothetical protein
MPNSGGKRLNRYCAGDKIENNEKGEACRAYGEERGVYRVSVGIDGRIILRWIFRKWDVGVWIGLS